MLKFDKKPKRDTPLTVRLPEDTVQKLKEISARYDVSQSQVIERLIEDAYAEIHRGSNKKK